MYPSRRGCVKSTGLPDRTATAKLTLAGSCELSTMANPGSDYPQDVTVYLVVNDFGKFGKAFVETDIAEADREAIIRNFISGQYSNALRVVAFNTAEGWSRDVSEDIANEVLERAFDADDTLSEDTKRFIDRHVSLGEKRPRAPSVRREGVRQKKRA
jgi:hypothetical protein